MLNNNEEISNAFEVEISKAKRRLDQANLEREEMDRRKQSLIGETSAMEKHLVYLGEQAKTKEEELEAKKRTIAGLDSQVEDKQKQFDELQSEVGKLSKVLSDKQADLALAVEELEQHQTRISRESDNITEAVRLTNTKHDEAHKKLQRIRDFLNEIQ